MPKGKPTQPTQPVKGIKKKKRVVTDEEDSPDTAAAAERQIEADDARLNASDEPDGDKPHDEASVDQE